MWYIQDSMNAIRHARQQHSFVANLTYVTCIGQQYCFGPVLRIIEESNIFSMWNFKCWFKGYFQTKIMYRDQLNPVLIWFQNRAREVVWILSLSNTWIFEPYRCHTAWVPWAAQRFIILWRIKKPAGTWFYLLSKTIENPSDIVSPWKNKRCQACMAKEV